MSVTASFDIEAQHGSSTADDVALDGLAVEGNESSSDIVIIDEPSGTPAPAPTALPFHGDPVMTFVYFGVISFVAIVVLSALLAL